MTRYLAALLASSSMCLQSSATLWAEQSAPPPRTLLQTRLDVSLDTLRLRPGAPILASVLVPWSGPDCVLKVGATVYGQVTEVSSKHKGQHESSLKVLFDRADCNGERAVPITLVLFAVINSNDDPTGQQAYSSQLFGATSLHPITQSAANKTLPVDNSVLINNIVMAADAAHALDPHVPNSVKAGQVIDAGKVTLDVGTGPELPSVLRSEKQDFAINRKAELVLVASLQPKPHQPALARREEVVASIPVKKADPKTPLLPDVTEVCAAGECSELHDPVQGVEGALRSIPIANLGYRPRHHVQMSEFDRDSSISYLTPQQILVTFDLHRLRSRLADTWPITVHRQVRAVLLDAKTGKVQRVSDWNVDGSGQYLWSAGPGRVLVHMGGALHIFGPNLLSEAVLPARGDLLWVSVSPAGRRIALAMVNERHTREVHEQIASLTSVAPEEDIEVRVFDRNGELLLSHADSSDVRTPVLTDSGGEIVLRRERDQRWQILEQVAETKHVVATVNSSCAPSISATSNDAFFVVGCASGGRWYRVIRKNGRTLMKVPPSDQEIEQRALANGDSIFAVRVVDLTNAPSAQFLYSTTSLHDERISVHRSSDGHEMMLARVKSFPQTRSSFALSTDERQLALLTEDDVVIYQIPAGASTSER